MLTTKEFYCYGCQGYAIVEMKEDNSIRVTPCQCQFEEEDN